MPHIRKILFYIFRIRSILLLIWLILISLLVLITVIIVLIILIYWSFVAFISLIAYILLIFSSIRLVDIISIIIVITWSICILETLIWSLVWGILIISTSGICWVFFIKIQNLISKITKWSLCSFRFSLKTWFIVIWIWSRLCFYFILIIVLRILSIVCNWLAELRIRWNRIVWCFKFIQLFRIWLSFQFFI